MKVNQKSCAQESLEGRGMKLASSEVKQPWKQRYRKARGTIQQQIETDDSQGWGVDETNFL